jgi:hypothetical protein
VLAWFFATVWHALVGFILLSGLLLAAVYVLARAITENTAHDQATCDCVDCQRRRNVASRKRWSRTDSKPDSRTAGPWISTLDLIDHGPGTRVRVKGAVYEFMAAEPGGGRWTIRLMNLSTRKKTLVTVRYESGERRCWNLSGRNVSRERTRRLDDLDKP